MDPITHTMVGAVLARTVGDRRTPLAGATLMLAANAPDIDIYSAWTETSFGSIAFRRGWTHGPIALALLPFAVTLLVLGYDRLRRQRSPERAAADPRWVLALATLGVISHPALDWLNTYGIRLLMPLSPRWFYGDAVFIIDPYWWALLAITLVLARRGASALVVRRVALVALAYPLTMVVVGKFGERIAADAAREAGIAGVREVMYQPAMGNPLAAQLVAVTDAGYHYGRLAWWASPRVRYDGTVIARGDWTDPRVQAAMRDPDVRDYLVWSRFPWVQIEATAADGSAAVGFGDARFPRGGLAGGLGGLSVTVPPQVH